MRYDLNIKNTDMNRHKQKSGMITESEKHDALSIANNLLEKVKRKEKNKIAVRVDNNTVILMKDNLSEEEMAERVAAFKQQMEINKTYF